MTGLVRSASSIPARVTPSLNAAGCTSRGGEAEPTRPQSLTITDPDLFAAFNAARAAWEKRQEQMTLEVEA